MTIEFLEELKTYFIDRGSCRCLRRNPIRRDWLKKADPGEPRPDPQVRQRRRSTEIGVRFELDLYKKSLFQRRHDLHHESESRSLGRASPRPPGADPRTGQNPDRGPHRRPGHFQLGRAQGLRGLQLLPFTDAHESPIGAGFGQHRLADRDGRSRAVEAISAIPEHPRPYEMDPAELEVGCSPSRGPLALANLPKNARQASTVPGPLTHAYHGTSVCILRGLPPPEGPSNWKSWPESPSTGCWIANLFEKGSGSPAS